MNFFKYGTNFNFKDSIKGEPIKIRWAEVKSQGCFALTLTHSCEHSCVIGYSQWSVQTWMKTDFTGAHKQTTTRQ